MLDSIPHMVAHQLEMIFFKFGETSLPFREQPPWWFGLSSFAYLLLLTHPRLWYKVAIVFQAIASFASDHVTSGQYSLWHGVDRVYAPIMFAYTIYIIAKAISWRRCLVAAFPRLFVSLPPSTQFECRIGMGTCSGT